MASDKKEAAPAAPAAEDKGTPGKKGGKKIIIAAAVVALLEVGTVVLTMKMSSGPKSALAEQPAVAAVVVEKESEVKLVDAKLPNTQSGKLWLYDMQVVAKVSEKHKEKVTELYTERESQIRDRIRTIVASSDPKSLAEPGLETLRRQIAYQLEQDIGKELIKEVLIPKCTPIRAE